MTRAARQDRNAGIDLRGEKRSNATHASTTDPEVRLYKKSPGAGTMLCFMGHMLMENRSGLIVQTDLTQADGKAERRAALDMIHRHSTPRRLDVYVDPHPQRRQGLRQRRLRRRSPAGLRDPACRPKGRGTRPSTGAPPVIPAVPPRRSAARRSRSPAAGPGPWAAGPRPSIAASSGFAPGSPSPWPPATSPDCRDCWPRDRGNEHELAIPPGHSSSRQTRQIGKTVQLPDFFSRLLEDLQILVAVHASVSNHFNQDQDRSLSKRRHLKTNRAAALIE